jgi:transposase
MEPENQLGDILHAVSRQATKAVRYVALYMHFFQKLSPAAIGNNIGKSPQAVRKWIRQYKAGEGVTRKQRDTVYKLYSADKRVWVILHVCEKPCSYLEETKWAYEEHFGETISRTTIWTILHENGIVYKAYIYSVLFIFYLQLMPWCAFKAIEQRSMNIRFTEVLRFANDLDLLPWSPDNLVMLDEVSVDNRACWRSRGYGKRGRRLVHRGDFRRLPRISLLSFINLHGIAETYLTDGTFTSKSFAQHCLEFAHSGVVEQLPGRNSVWILDNARIHCDPALVTTLRSMGIGIVFLPPYCPFFNPIEIFFGKFKGRLRKLYNVKDQKKLTAEALACGVLSIMNAYRNFDMRPYFSHCGYVTPGCFDWEKAYSRDIDQNATMSPDEINALKRKHELAVAKRKESEEKAVQRYRKKTELNSKKQ